MTRHTPREESEAGIALIVTILLLLMISAIGLSALQHAGDENVAGSSLRRKLRSTYAADAALNIVSDRLLSTTGPIPDLSPLDTTDLTVWPDALFIDDQGFRIHARTGTADNATPQPILRVGRTRSSGSQLNVGAAGSFSYGVYRVGVVASDPGGGGAGIAALQAQITVPEGSAGYR